MCHLLINENDYLIKHIMCHVLINYGTKIDNIFLIPCCHVTPISKILSEPTAHCELIRNRTVIKVTTFPIVKCSTRYS